MAGISAPTKTPGGRSRAALRPGMTLERGLVVG